MKWGRWYLTNAIEIAVIIITDFCSSNCTEFYFRRAHKTCWELRALYQMYLRKGKVKERDGKWRDASLARLVYLISRPGDGYVSIGLLSRALLHACECINFVKFICILL